MAQLSGRTYEQMRVAVLEFLDTDVFNISVENCVSFLATMIDSWDIDLRTLHGNPAQSPTRRRQSEAI